MNSDVAVGYDSMKFILTALRAIKGKVEDKEAFLKAMHTTKIKGVVSKTLSLDENGNVIRDIVIRKVEKKGGVVKNAVLDVLPHVRQPPQGTTVMPGK
jgi:branched-chain amino acid transport system substrate-binding protein